MQSFNSTYSLASTQAAKYELMVIGESLAGWEAGYRESNRLLRYRHSPSPISHIEDEEFHGAHAILLEWSQPGIHALVALSELRLWPLFVIGDMIDLDIVAAYRLGADVCLPLKTSEAMLYEYTKKYVGDIENTLGVASPQAETQEGKTRFAMDECPIKLDIFLKKATWNQKEVLLREKECRILLCLIENRQTLVSRNELMACVWGEDVVSTPNSLDAQVSSVRKRLRALGLPDAIETIRGVGYRMVV